MSAFFSGSTRGFCNRGRRDWGCLISSEWERGKDIVILLVMIMVLYHLDIVNTVVTYRIALRIAAHGIGRRRILSPDTISSSMSSGRRLVH